MREREIRAQEARKIEVEALQQGCAEEKETEKETEALRAMLTEATKKAREAEDTEMSGTNPTSHKNTTYVQAVAQIQYGDESRRRTWVSTNWGLNRMADYVERVTGRVIA